MKKTLLSIIASLLLLPFLAAQTSFYANDVNEPYADTDIVRSWDNGKAAITYYEIGLKKYIQYVDYQTGNSYRAAAPDSVQILDMYIYNDMVYYCGFSVFDTGGVGVVGYFKPVEFISSTHVDYHTLTVSPLKHVKKLVVQENPTAGGIDVIAIGENKWYDTVFNAAGHVIQLIPHLDRYFLFCRDIMQTTVSYEYGEVPPDEHYYDVLLTDNYVVFVGAASYLSQYSSCIRATTRTNTSYPTWQLDKIYIYPTGGTEIYSATHSVATNKDSIASAYMHINPSTGAVSNRVRIFDIASMDMVYSQEYIVPDKSEVRDIVYIPQDNSLVCMQDFDTPLNLYNSNFVYLNPTATVNYNAYIEFIMGKFFKSITKKSHKHYLASNGPVWFLKDKLSIGAYPYPFCPQGEEIKCKVLKNIEKMLNTIPITPLPDSNIIIQDRKLIEPRNISVICNNP